MTIALVVALIVSWVVVGFISWLLYMTVRQQGRVLLAHEEIGVRMANAEALIQRLAERITVLAQAPAPAAVPQTAAAPAAPPALSLGTPAPEFRLADLKGRFRTLADYRGKPAVMVFFNPDCGFCTQLAPRLGEVPASAPQLIVMSRGDKQVNRQLARTHRWKGDVLLEPNWEVATSYRTNATPTGYLVDADGRIASTLAVGVEGVMQLTKMLNGAANGNGHDLTAEALAGKQDAAVEKAKAAGLAITDSKLQRNGLPKGTEAPNFTLPDLDGRERTLADFRGKQTLLVFSDPGCGPCQTLAPSLAQLQEAHRGNNLNVLMVSKGDLEANRQKAKEHGFTFPVVLQRNWEISKDYAMFATPVGYLIDERGLISKDVAIGGDAILRLVSG